jgi:circadian clock protein KaiC
MPRLMQTGIEGLDRVLCGGFLYHNSILLKGAPGCGKTTLGMQIVYNGATLYDEPGVIVLFEQFPQQLFRDVSSYGWDLRGLEEAGKLRVLFSEPEEVVSPDRMIDPPLVSKVQAAALEIGARRVLVDSVSHILNLTRDQREARGLLLRFINALKSIGLTPVLTAEAENAAGAIGVDEYLTDCVVNLSSEAARNKTFAIRELSIRKTRGHDHLRGRHVFRLTNRGVEVYPRTPGRLPESGVTATGALGRLSSGISGLDELLGGGYTQGTSTIIAGMPGTFKTTLGVQFVTKGARADEKCVLVSLSERPGFLARLMEEKGLPVGDMVAQGRLKVLHYVPKETFMEEVLAHLEAEFRSGGVTRLTVDGINEIERGIEEPDAYKDIIQAFLTLCQAYGVTALFTQKLEQLSGTSPLANINYASMFDGIIYLGTLEIESAVHKVVSVLKMRGGSFSTDLCEITCDSKGLTVLDKFVGLSGILSGNAQGQYKKTVEELFQPLYFIRDFLEMLGSPDLDEAQRAAIIENLRAEANKLVDKLKTHFNVKN